MHPASRVSFSWLGSICIYGLFSLSACGDGDGPVPGPDAGTPADCSEFPIAEGCPCLAGGLADCYAAPEETRGVGLCRGGRTSCVAGRWAACSGAVLPRPEICDGEDEDCDGFADDGARSPCGGCDRTCIGGVWGEPDAPFLAD